MILNHLSQAGNFTEKDKNALIAAIHEQNKSKYDKVDRIAEYQKYVNTELDSCCCLLTSLYTPVVGQYLPFYKASGSMEVQDGLVTVKPGQRVQINVSLGYRGTSSDTKFANIAYAIRDCTNNKDIRYYQPLAGSYQYEIPYDTHIQYTNNTDADCQIGVYVSKIYTNKDLDPLYCNFTVMEIGRAVTIDPVEYVNTSQGIEDAPVGHIISHMGTVAPKHYLVCDGAEYPIADYPYLVQHIKDNFGGVNYFGGDGESTFAVPDLTNRFLQGSDTPGVYQEPGLPNITANWKSEPSTDAQGAVTVVDENGNLMAVTSGGKVDNRLWFDASLSSAIYGNSETVTPANISVLYCIKYEPTYYMQVHQTNYIQSNVYSEAEQVVGRWIDGRPIYRKTFQGIIPSDAVNDKTAIVGSIEAATNEICNMFGAINRGDIWAPIPYYKGQEYNTAFFISSVSGAIIANVGSHFAGKSFVFCVEYTKTTDEPNSFTNDMIQDYVTTEPYSDEQVLKAVDALWP